MTSKKSTTGKITTETSVRKARKSAQAYFREYREVKPVGQLVKSTASVMQEYTQSGGVRPFGVSLLVAGMDGDGVPRLFQVDPSGAYFGWKATAIGKVSFRRIKNAMNVPCIGVGSQPVCRALTHAWSNRLASVRGTSTPRTSSRSATRTTWSSRTPCTLPS